MRDGQKFCPLLGDEREVISNGIIEGQFSHN
jgi:hypothetical protein